MLRVLCVGFPKTGTSTLARAFREAGLVTIHGGVKRPAARLMWDAWQAGEDPAAGLPRGTEALCEVTVTLMTKGRAGYWPCLEMDFLRYVRGWYPGCLFLLHTRDLAAWLSSVDRWKDLRRRIVGADLPGLPRGVGADDREMLDWHQGHLDRVRAAFGDDPRFLEVAIEDPGAPRKIGEALGLELPWWGVENANLAKRR